SASARRRRRSGSSAKVTGRAATTSSTSRGRSTSSASRARGRSPLRRASGSWTPSRACSQGSDPRGGGYALWLPAAGAVEAAVLGTGAARLFEPLAELLPGAVVPHFEVVARDAQPLGHLLRPGPAEVHPLDELGVFRLQRREQRFEADAERDLVLV